MHILAQLFKSADSVGLGQGLSVCNSYKLRNGAGGNAAAEARVQGASGLPGGLGLM